MAPYYPITVHRSDGLLMVITKSGIKEANEPTAAQQNDTPDAKGNVDYYKRLDPKEPKAVDWRRKLGGMLMHLLGGNEHAGKQYILKEIPEGYVLWEHLKYNVDKVNGTREKGKHAGGTFERQDAYLYGHPQGRKKRFRSPADFFHHLLWLAVDTEGNPMNCSCKICSPDGDDDATEESMKTESISRKAIKPVPVPATVMKSSQNMISAAPLISSKLSVAPTPAPAPIKPSFQLGNGEVKTTAEQRADSEANGKYLYRTGELVWFNNDLNWRLGIIAKRQLLTDKPRYLLQPLSNPYQHQQCQIRDDENVIRPWLAWSVPLLTLKSMQGMVYDHVPWERVLRGELNGEKDVARDYMVDGSILAAQLIDSCYSLYDRIEGALAGPGEAHYRGMFLGAEKIWVGEPVRLRFPGNDIVVLIVHKLIERTTPLNTSNVTFVGDVYKLVDMPTPYKSRAEWPTPSLPARMVSDLRWRNEVADAAKTGQWYEWRLLDTMAKKGLSDIKGRWYESRTLLPILRGAQVFHNDVIVGQTSDAGAWMNGRMDKNPNIVSRKKNRRDTLGKAVPVDFKVSRGLDGNASDDVFPDEQQSQAGQPLTFVETDIDQFMDLDQVGTHNDFYVH